MCSLVVGMADQQWVWLDGTAATVHTHNKEEFDDAQATLEHSIVESWG